MLGVRFIAINDNYDSLSAHDTGNEIMLPFKNLINDVYSRDISIKIRTHLDVKRKNGEYIGAFVTYGYLKSEENKNKLIVDEYAAKVVQDIFKMKLSGMNQQAIADKLNQNGILSPLEYKKSIGIDLVTTFQTRHLAKWSYVAVTRILKNDIYTGAITQGKRTTPNYKIKTRVYKPENEWIRVDNNHEAVISRNDYERVQELLKADTRCSPSQDVLCLFSGIIYCGDCMESMVRRTVPADGKKYIYYVCSNNKRDKKQCSSHRFSEKELKESILYLVQLHINEILGLEEALKAVEHAPFMENSMMKYEGRRKKKQEELEKIERRKINLYEDFKEGVINQGEYMQLKQEYGRQMRETELAVQSLESEMQLLLENRGHRQEWIVKFKKYKNIQTLDRNTVVILIKQIFVYEKKRIEVVYNFEDEFKKYKHIADRGCCKYTDASDLEVV